MTGALAGQNVPYSVSAAILGVGAVMLGVVSHGWLAEPSPTQAQASPPRVDVPPSAPVAATPVATAPPTPSEAPAPVTHVMPPSLCRPLVFRFAAGAERAWTGPTEDQIAAVVSRAESARLVVIGHADRSGNPDANLRLSHRRANRVADFLVTRGLERSRVTVRALGEFAPLTNSEAPEANNRRVEVHLRGAEECPTTTL